MPSGCFPRVRDLFPLRSCRPGIVFLVFWGCFPGGWGLVSSRPRVCLLVSWCVFLGFLGLLSCCPGIVFLVPWGCFLGFLVVLRCNSNVEVGVYCSSCMDASVAVQQPC